jgi:hypothetical protein
MGPSGSCDKKPGDRKPRAVVPLKVFPANSKRGQYGALTIRPPTNRPRDISTHTIRPPDKPSAVTFYYCDIPSQGGRIVRPPKIVQYRTKKKRHR